MKMWGKRADTLRKPFLEKWDLENGIRQNQQGTSVELDGKVTEVIKFLWKNVQMQTEMSKTSVNERDDMIHHFLETKFKL